MALAKKVVRSGVPETGGPFNLGVTFGPLLFVSAGGALILGTTGARSWIEARRAG